MTIKELARWAANNPMTPEQQARIQGLMIAKRAIEQAIKDEVAKTLVQPLTRRQREAIINNQTVLENKESVSFGDGQNADITLDWLMEMNDRQLLDEYLTAVLEIY